MRFIQLEAALTHALASSLGPGLKPINKKDEEAVLTLMELRAKLGIKTEASPPHEVAESKILDS